MQLNRTKEEYLALLEDTVKYYSEDPSRRSKNDSGYCVYKSENGNRCAVGRFLVKDFNYYLYNTENSVEDLYNYYSETDEFLIPEYRGYDIDFWSTLQVFHDEGKYWDKTGLTDDGKLAVERIKMHINAGCYCTNH